MSYLVLARKYRPQKFSELIGQDHVTQTLQNAFKQNKVGQAYLFTGTRGVGKTSLGRILAKALRCEAPESQPGQANYGIPCNTCASCLEVGQSSALDVLEIDGASNNGVDNVREIRDNVRFHPTRGRMKVYIVDEVHMLTGAAFNALLKTLEEPPAHVAFIFATTEVQKVPATILSRCQRFDLRRVPQQLIFDYLVRITKLEKIQAKADALQLIARKAEGSIRDSLSLLDQVIALAGKEISITNASAALGIVAQDLVTSILGSALGNQGLAAIERVQQAFESGVEMKNLAVELAETLRNAVLVKIGASAELTGILADEQAELARLTEKTPLETLQAAFQVLAQAIPEITRSTLPKASLEMVLLRITHLGSLASVSTLLKRLENLEAMAAGQANSVLGSVPSPTPPAVEKMPRPAAAPAPATEVQEISWKNFVAFVTKQKPSLGTLLEHAIPLTPPEEWKRPACRTVKLAFREHQTFYFEQATAPVMFGPLEKLLGTYVGAERKLEIERLEKAGATAAPALATAANTANTQTISEKKEEARGQKIDSLKQKLLNQDIIRDTHEIFGAELAD